MPAKSVGRPVTDEQAPVAAENTAKTEQKFQVEKLRANSMRLFSVTTSTFDGAMYGHKETEMTIAEARAVINKWLGRKE